MLELKPKSHVSADRFHSLWTSCLPTIPRQIEKDPDLRCVGYYMHFIGWDDMWVQLQNLMSINKGEVEKKRRTSIFMEIRRFNSRPPKRLCLQVRIRDVCDCSWHGFTLPETWDCGYYWHRKVGWQTFWGHPSRGLGDVIFLCVRGNCHDWAMAVFYVGPGEVSSVWNGTSGETRQRHAHEHTHTHANTPLSKVTLHHFPCQR